MTADTFQHYPPGDPPGGPTLIDLIQGMHQHWTRIAASIPDPAKIRRDEADNVWSVDIDPTPVPITAGFGILDLPQTLGPGLGEHWDVHTISATGFTAGSVLGWVNAPGASIVQAYGTAQQAALRFIGSSAGFANYGKGQCHLRNNDRLVFVASGITLGPSGQVLVSLSATRVADGYWGRYLI